MKFAPLLFLLLFASIAGAETTGALIQQLTDAVRTELNGSTYQKNPYGGYQYQIFESMVDIKVNYADDRPRPGAPDQLLKAIGKLETTSTSKATQDLCRTLDKQLRREIAELQASEVEKIKKEIPTAIRTALAARTTRDFDAPLATLSNAFSDSYITNTNDRLYQDLVQEVERTEDLLRGLQDYVANAGQESPVINKNRWASLLSTRTELTHLLPRSELLTGLEEFRKRVDVAAPDKPITQEEFETKGWQIVAEAKSLEDLEKTNAQLAAWIHADAAIGMKLDSLSQAVSTLHEFARSYYKVKSGTISQLEIASLITHQADIRDDTLRNLNNQLILAGLSQVLQAPKATNDETPAGYVQRVAKQAAATEDWPLYARAMAGLPVTPPGLQAPAADRLATQSFLAGINQTRARLYALAVRSFESALHSGSFAIPSEMIGLQLEKIRQEHPQEFEAGEKMLPNPPTNPETNKVPFTLTPQFPFHSR